MYSQSRKSLEKSRGGGHQGNQSSIYAHLYLTLRARLTFLVLVRAVATSTTPLTPRPFDARWKKSTGFLCTIASLRNGQRTLRISFASVSTPTFEALQNLLGRGAGDFEALKNRLSLHSGFLCTFTRLRAKFTLFCLTRGGYTSPVNEDDDEAAIDEAAQLDFRRSISRFILSAVLTIPGPGFSVVPWL